MNDITKQLAEPSAWLVLDKDGSLVHAAAYRESAHEHINDAINEYGIREAARWVVRPAYIHAATKAETKILTERERKLLEGLIDRELRHAAVCDAIPNQYMAEKQKGWDLERVALLRKLAGIGASSGDGNG